MARSLLLVLVLALAVGLALGLRGEVEAGEPVVPTAADSGADGRDRRGPASLSSLVGPRRVRADGEPGSAAAELDELLPPEREAPDPLLGLDLDLIEDLRDDDESWNATEACEELGRRLADPAHCAGLRMRLGGALFSDDAQQRRLALGLLQSTALRRDAYGRQLDPSARLLQLAEEELEDWYPWRRAPLIPHAPTEQRSLAFALVHTDRMRPHLERLLTSEYRGPKLAAAYVLAKDDAPPVARIAPVLVRHLADNNMQNDALMAVEALAALGEAARPWLVASPADAQAAECQELLLARLDGRSAVPAGQRSSLTWRSGDPTRGLTYLEPRGFLSE